MKKILLTLLSIYAMPGWAGTLKNVTASGEGRATLTFQCEGTVVSSLVSSDNGEIQLVLKPATLDSKWSSKLSVETPHLLIRSIEVTPHLNRPDELLAVVRINGTSEDLNKRIKLNRSGLDWTLSVDLPKGLSAAALQLLQEEQAPILAKEPVKKVSSGTSTGTRVLIGMLLLAITGGGVAFGWRILKAKAPRLGTRRYLIETLAQVPVGPQGKASVCLLRVGQEFVLVGVTGQSVSMLSTLPKLEAQYHDESKLERESFREAVAEESKRVSATPAGRMGFSV